MNYNKTARWLTTFFPVTLGIGAKVEKNVKDCKGFIHREHIKTFMKDATFKKSTY